MFWLCHAVKQVRAPRSTITVDVERIRAAINDAGKCILSVAAPVPKSIVAVQTVLSGMQLIEALNRPLTTKKPNRPLVDTHFEHKHQPSSSTLAPPAVGSALVVAADET